MENKQNIIDEDVQAKLDLLDAIIESKCEYDGEKKTAQWLAENFGVSLAQLEKWGFETPIYDDEDEENEDYGTDDGEREYRSILNEQANKWNAEVNRR